MLGSIDDAEDQVQETLLRAWRSYGDFEGRSSLRTWLYRIATNACLRALENRSRRPLPSGLGGPDGDPYAGLRPDRPEVPWLQPLPDALATPGPDDPAAVAVSHASLRLALIAALQYLPLRQRAVLILRDVLGWRAAEVAGLIGTTTTAVNSSLQRARARIGDVAPAEDDLREPADPSRRDLLRQYAAAFENADVAGLTRLLRAEAVLEMPPQPGWFAGRDQVSRFLAHRVLRQAGYFRLFPAAANGQPAFAAYTLGASGAYEAHAIQVLTLTRAGDSIAAIASFNDPALVPLFGFPATVDVRPAKVPALAPSSSPPS